MSPDKSITSRECSIQHEQTPECQEVERTYVAVDALLSDEAVRAAQAEYTATFESMGTSYHGEVWMNAAIQAAIRVVLADATSEKEQR